MTYTFCTETVSYTWILGSTVDSSSSFKPLNFLSQSSLYILYFLLYKDKNTNCFGTTLFLRQEHFYFDNYKLCNCRKRGFDCEKAFGLLFRTCVLLCDSKTNI